MRFKPGQKVKYVAKPTPAQLRNFLSELHEIASPIVPDYTTVYTVKCYDLDRSSKTYLCLEEIPVWQDAKQVWWMEDMFAPLDDLEETLSNVDHMVKHATPGPKPVTSPLRKRELETVSKSLKPVL